MIQVEHKVCMAIVLLIYAFIVIRHAKYVLDQVQQIVLYAQIITCISKLQLRAEAHAQRVMYQMMLQISAKLVLGV